MLPGVEVWTTTDLGDIAGKRIGLITNHTGRTRAGESTIDVLHRDARIRLTALFAPEHGIRGTAEAGENIDAGTDARTGLPIHSLYGEHVRPSAPMLRDVDVLVFDIQDIGTRYYTYVWSMVQAMEAAAEFNRMFVVLDRPNPIGGEHVQGRNRDRRTLVGLYPTVMRHGMTAGEIARWVNAEFRIGVNLRVIPMQGWRRSMWWDETGIPWIPPSPNMPSVESATHYPGTCLFEGTTLSVGRGTPMAFQQIGAPWLDAGELVRRLNALGLPGVRFEAVTFTPVRPGDGKHPDLQVNGIRFRTTDRSRYDPTLTAVHVMVEIRRLHGDQLTFIPASIDRLSGSAELRLRVSAGESATAITRDWEEQVERFRATRENYLLYR